MRSSSRARRRKSPRRFVSLSDRRVAAEQLARFEDDVCPLVAGMPRDWTAVLTRMIRDNVVAVGGKVGKPGCKYNAVVIFIDQPQELVKALAEAEPGFFAMTPRELANFTATPRPVSSWHVTDTRDRDGKELGSVGAIGGTTRPMPRWSAMPRPRGFIPPSARIC